VLVKYAHSWEPPSSRQERATTSFLHTRAWLLELELRLEAILAEPQFSASLKGPREPFRTETCTMLEELRVEQTGGIDIAQLVALLLEREPMPLILAVPELLLGGRGVGPVEPDLLARLLPWALDPAVPRGPRDALALLIAVPTLAQLESSTALATLERWCGAVETPLIRFGLVTLAGLAARAPALIAVKRAKLVGLCCSLGSSRERELTTAVGWALRELVTESPEVTLGLLQGEVGRLSRASLRIALERLPHAARGNLLSAQRLSRARRATEPSARTLHQCHQLRVPEQPGCAEEGEAEAEHGAEPVSHPSELVVRERREGETAREPRE